MNRNKSNYFFSAGLSLLAIFIFSGLAQAAPLVPPPGKTILVIGQNKEAIDTYVQEIDVPPAGVMFYTSVQTLDGLVAPFVEYTSVQHGEYLRKKYPDAVMQIGLYMVDALDGILAGEYDDNITKLGQWIKDAKRPIYLRIGYEFDGPHNHYDPELYKRAYRYIVDHLRAQKIRNAAFVWHSFGYLRTGKPIMDWYPGDDYVDWFGISFFSPYKRANYVSIIRSARARKKPVMFAESSPREADVGLPLSEKTWNRWFKRYFDLIEEYDVEMACYITGNWDANERWVQEGGWGDARVHTIDLIKQNWLKTIKQPRYLRGSKNLFQQLK